MDQKHLRRTGAVVKEPSPSRKPASLLTPRERQSANLRVSAVCDTPSVFIASARASNTSSLSTSS